MRKVGGIFKDISLAFNIKTPLIALPTK